MRLFVSSVHDSFRGQEEVMLISFFFCSLGLLIARCSLSGSSLLCIRFCMLKGKFCSFPCSCILDTIIYFCNFLLDSFFQVY
jgi:hypothetical protein